MGVRQDIVTSTTFFPMGAFGRCEGHHRRFEIFVEDLLEPVVVASFGFVVLAHESPRFHRLQAMYLRLAADFFGALAASAARQECTFRSSW